MRTRSRRSACWRFLVRSDVVELFFQLIQRHFATQEALSAAAKCVRRC